MTNGKPKPTGNPNSLQETSSAGEIAAFLKKARKSDPTGNGRLIFALDATMSRQPTWDRAMQLQASMFDAVGKTGGLSVQLVYFRGFGECQASKWVVDAVALCDLMIGIDCRGGQTQIGKVLSHAAKENVRQRVNAMVFIGDAMEENIDQLCAKAGELGIKGTRCFFFQEGGDPLTERAFREMASLTSGAYFKLGPDSAHQLSELLGAIAVYSKGGLKALESSKAAGARKLLAQLK